MTKGSFKWWLFCVVMAMPFGREQYIGYTHAHEYNVEFNLSQRSVADQVISIFENNTPELQYGYAAAIGDGRGITAGRAGFTSATGDMYLVVKNDIQINPASPLKPYEKRLKKLAKSWSPSILGLKGLPAAWLVAAQDANFRAVQDSVVNELYYNRAVNFASEYGLSEPVSLLVLYDTIVQHGYGTDPDGLPSLLKRNTRTLGGSPHNEIDEIYWLRNLLLIRKQTLLNASNSDTRQVWRESAPRADTLLAIIESGNVKLDRAFTVKTWGTAFTIYP